MSSHSLCSLSTNDAILTHALQFHSIKEKMLNSLLIFCISCCWQRLTKFIMFCIFQPMFDYIDIDDINSHDIRTNMEISRVK